MKSKYNLYLRSVDFAYQVLLICRRIPICLTNRSIIDQLVRSSSSIGANYAEASDALSNKDRIAKISISRKEAKETMFWIDLCIRAFKDIDFSYVKSELAEIMKILGTIQYKLVNKCNSKENIP